MQIHLVERQSEWIEEMTAQGKVEFLQSWEFGDFLQHMGRTIWRLQGIFNGEVVQMQCIIQRIFGGFRFAYAPRAYIRGEYLESFLEYLSSKGIIFLRLESINEIDFSHVKERKSLNRQAQHRWILDVRPTEKKLLQSMHQKTRYNIKLAHQKGVIIDEKKDLNLFWQLDQETTARKKYEANPKTYYAALLKSPTSLQTNAYYHGHPVASSLLLRYKDSLIYLFGASSNSDRNVMAPALLQWYNIRKAKELGCVYYDWLGVAPPPTQGSGTVQEFHGYRWDGTHPFSNVTRFKAGFGGFVRSFPEAHDIILRTWAYRLYRLSQVFLSTGNR